MNETLKKAAKGILLELLEKCTEGQRNLFKRMYSSDDLERPMEDVVDKMEGHQLDWGITQCENTLKKRKDEQK